MVQVLDGLSDLGPASGEDDVLVSNDFADDAAVVRMGDGDLATILTADVIAPLVDDAEAFGEIAATNAISDVYAMGGRPRFALNLIFFPDDKLPKEVLADILKGGAKACARAGTAIVGGHSVRDVEVKYGLSVVGEVHADAILDNRGARPGDRLIVTKALGTGVIGTAAKKELASAEELAAAIESMTTHNGAAVDIARQFGVTACTDITGFGLLGHLRNILRGSAVDAAIELSALPLLPGALAHTKAGRVPGGSKANLEFLADSLEVGDGTDEHRLTLAGDAQTSGGLLLCIPPDQAGDCIKALADAGTLASAEVGELRQPKTGGGTVYVR